jgi:hypothetical protein
LLHAAFSFQPAQDRICSAPGDVRHGGKILKVEIDIAPTQLGAADEERVREAEEAAAGAAE